MKFRPTAILFVLALMVFSAAIAAPSTAKKDHMVSIELAGAQALKDDLTAYPARAQRILVRALNRGIGAGRTLMVREIAGDTGLKSRDVREKLVMQEASIARPEASLKASLKRIPLIDFGARGPEPSRGRGRGVSYRLPGSPGRNPHAFIATLHSGHRGVFMRTGTGRLPIVELHGPSLGRVFGKFRPIGLARAEEIFRTNLEHELSRIRWD